MSAKVTVDPDRLLEIIKSLEAIANRFQELCQQDAKASKVLEAHK